MSDLFVPAALSVSELNHLAKNLLEDQLAGLWVGGEVSNLVKAASGHYYFVLKDQRAQVRCTLFKHAARSLAALLREGEEVEVLGKITLYEARGEFQINVQEVRRKGLGQLFEAYERLKQRLQAEGLFDAARKRPLPPAPQCIGVGGMDTIIETARYLVWDSGLGFGGGLGSLKFILPLMAWCCSGFPAPSWQIRF